MHNILVFTINEQLFGFNVLQIKEIDDSRSYFVVPKSDKSIRGILNIRGQIITIFDLRQIFGWDATTLTGSTKNIIFKTEHETEFLNTEYQLHTSNDVFGFMVEKICDIENVSDDSIQPPPANVDRISKEYITGVVELKEGILTLLDVEKLIENREMGNGN